MNDNPNTFSIFKQYVADNGINITGNNKDREDQSQSIILEITKTDVNDLETHKGLIEKLLFTNYYTLISALSRVNRIIDRYELERDSEEVMQILQVKFLEYANRYIADKRYEKDMSFIGGFLKFTPKVVGLEFVADNAGISRVDVAFITHLSCVGMIHKTFENSGLQFYNDLTTNQKKLISKITLGLIKRYVHENPNLTIVQEQISDFFNLDRLLHNALYIYGLENKDFFDKISDKIVLSETPRSLLKAGKMIKKWLMKYEFKSSVFYGIDIMSPVINPEPFLPEDTMEIASIRFTSIEEVVRHYLSGVFSKDENMQNFYLHYFGFQGNTNTFQELGEIFGISGSAAGRRIQDFSKLLMRTNGRTFKKQLLDILNIYHDFIDDLEAYDFEA